MLDSLKKKIILGIGIFSLLLLLFYSRQAKSAVEESWGEGSNSVPGELIVKLKGDSQTQGVKIQYVKKNSTDSGFPDGLRNKLEREYGLQGIREIGAGGYRILNKSNNHSGYYLLNFPREANLSEIMGVLKNHPHVAAVGKNIKVQAQYIPNDPRFAEQWALPRIKAPEAWDIQTGSSSTRIAVIDTGCVLDHPDLAPNINLSLSYDFVNNDSDPTDDNPDKHGTHVTGIIAGQGDNHQGVAGLNWRADMVIYKALGSDGYGTLDKLIEAIERAIDDNVQIINMSWGTSQDSPILEDILQDAYDSGIVLVAAGGNNGIVLYPAKYSFVLGVGGTGRAEGDPRWVSPPFESAYGPEIDVSAPAEDILSTVKYELPKGEPVYYASLSGTSMSSAFVSGLAGLILSQNPNLEPEEVYEFIKNNTDPVNTEPDKPMGSGRINLYKAIDAVSQPTPTPSPTPSATPSPTPSASPSPTPSPEVPEDEAWIEGKVEGEDCEDEGVKPLSGVRVVAEPVYFALLEDSPAKVKSQALPRHFIPIIDREPPEPIEYEPRLPPCWEEEPCPWEGEILAETTTDENGDYKLVITRARLEELGVEAKEGKYMVMVTAGDCGRRITPLPCEDFPYAGAPYAGQFPYGIATAKKASEECPPLINRLLPRPRCFPFKRGRCACASEELEIELAHKYNLDFLLQTFCPPKPSPRPTPTCAPRRRGGGCGGSVNTSINLGGK
ncbi:MAG: S8 family serine peptidase [Candidatus Omnitrophica bacterium]|nr:S8 family serine peptidase [Candidatus Omnitrophota bacterium]